MKPLEILNAGTSHLSDPNFLTFAMVVRDSLSQGSGLANYPLTVPPLVDLANAIDTFSALLGKKNADEVEARRAAREVLADILQLLALNLESQTPGNRPLLATTGFPLRKEREHNPAPTGQPQNLRVVSTGSAGEAKLICEGVEDVLTYEYQWSHDANAGPWVTLGSVSAIKKMVVTGLEPGKYTWFRVRATGPNGTGPWSDPAMMMVA